MRRTKYYTACGRMPRAWTELEHEDPIRIRFFYPCGYSQVVEAAKDKNMKRIAPVLLRRFASSYWSRGVVDECPKCRRAARKAQKESV